MVLASIDKIKQFRKVYNSEGKCISRSKKAKRSLIKTIENSDGSLLKIQYLNLFFRNKVFWNFEINFKSKDGTESADGGGKRGGW